MVGQLIYDLMIVVAWIGIWGISDTLIDKYVKDDPNARLAVYIALSIISLALIIWFYNINQQENEPPNFSLIDQPNT